MPPTNILRRARTQQFQSLTYGDPYRGK